MSDTPGGAETLLVNVFNVTTPLIIKYTKYNTPDNFFASFVMRFEFLVCVRVCACCDAPPAA